METVALLQRLPDVAEYYRRRFRHVLVDEYQDTNHAQYVLVRELVAPAHAGAEPRELCVVGDADQSIYAFRGASIRNIIEFERDFPDARTDPAGAELPLHADDPVGRERRDRPQPGPPRQAAVDRPRATGDQVVGYVADNEHDEAAFVAGEIDRLVDNGEIRNSRRRRLLPDQRPVPRVRGRVHPGRAAVQGGRRGALLRAPGGPRRPGLPAGAVQPGRHREPAADPERAQARHRRPGRGDRREYAERERISFAAALRVAAERPNARVRWPPGRSAASPRFVAHARRPCGAGRAAAPGTAELLEAVYARTGYTAELEASDDPQDASRVDNLAELVTVAREFAGDAAVADLAAWRRWTPSLHLDDATGVPEPGSLAAFLERVALVADADSIPDNDDGHGHADDPAHGQGPGVPGRVPHRLGGRHVPAHAGDGRPDGAGRGAPAGLRRHHAGPQRLYLSRALMRSAFGQPSANPASRFLDEVPASWSTGGGSEPERSAPVGRFGFGRRSGRRLTGPGQLEGARAHAGRPRSAWTWATGSTTTSTAWAR